MRVNDKPLEAWVIVRSDGTVQSAHCTCSNIAAVLFALEHGTRVSKEASVTDVPAYWLFRTAAKFSTPFQRICDMDFWSASKKRKLQLDGTVTPPLAVATQPAVSTQKITVICNPDASTAFF